MYLGRYTDEIRENSGIIAGMQVKIESFKISILTKVSSLQKVDGDPIGFRFIFSL